MEEAPMHISMYPWLALGHISPYVQLSNKLAQRGHRISIFIPTRTLSKLQHLNLHPHLITFIPITVPHVEGLVPHGAETTSDVDTSLIPLLMTAMDRTQKQVEDLLIQLKPNIVFFDFTHWLPDLARRLGIKSDSSMVLSFTVLLEANSISSFLNSKNCCSVLSYQMYIARLYGQSFRAGVEVKKGEEDGLFTKESVCEAVKSVMDEESEIGKEVRANHAKLRNILLSDNFESNYIDNFCHHLQDLLK
ncbi:hypothetical protein K1719_038879 [Acacia pycnantha]|nr:hypothetical protein K1719_038879 [Acacia pycnantha]